MDFVDDDDDDDDSTANPTSNAEKATAPVQRPDQATFVAIEFPGYIETPLKALEPFGGVEKLKSVCSFFLQSDICPRLSGSSRAGLH